MGKKKAFIFLMKSILLFLSTVAVLVLFFDPFYHYHKPLPFLKTVLEDRDFQVGGTIDHFEYDSLVVGTSIIENANLNEVNKLFNCNALKVIRASGRTSDLCYYIDRAYKKKNDIDTVIFAMSFEELLSDNEIELLDCDFAYLLDRNPINDIKYLLNKDVLLKKIPIQIAYSTIYEYDEAEPYSWYQSKDFSLSSCTSAYTPRTYYEDMRDSMYFDESLKWNLERMRTLVSNHPHTIFYLYMSPYSAFWWDDAYRSGQIEAYFSVMDQVYSCLSEYDNVRLYTYIYDSDITFDFDSYMDTLHFSPKWNSNIFSSMANGEGLYNCETFDSKKDNFYSNIKKFSESEIRQYYADAVTKY